MKIIGLTGSIAMGKSEVVKILRALGIEIFDADAAVHRLYDSQEGAELLQPIVPGAIRENRVDRAILAKLVSSDPTLLKKLESRVHAVVKQRRNNFIETATANGAEAVVLDIPLLFETGSDKQCDATIVVSAPAFLQRQRVLARPGMTEVKLELLLKRQLSDVEKRKRADVIIENDGDLALLQMRTQNALALVLADKETKP